MTKLYKFGDNTTLPTEGNVYARLNLKGPTPTMDSIIITNEKGEKLYGGKDMNGQYVSEIETNPHGLNLININSGGSSSVNVQEGEIDSDVSDESLQNTLTDSLLQTQPKEIDYSKINVMTIKQMDHETLQNDKDKVLAKFATLMVPDDTKENRESHEEHAQFLFETVGASVDEINKAMIPNHNNQKYEAATGEDNKITLTIITQGGGKRRRGGRKSTKKPKSRRNASRRRRRRSNKRRR